MTDNIRNSFADVRDLLVWTVEWWSLLWIVFFRTLPNFYLYVLFIISEGLSEKRQQKTEAEGKK